jgi:hypothetical protein
MLLENSLRETYKNAPSSWFRPSVIQDKPMRCMLIMQPITAWISENSVGYQRILKLLPCLAIRFEIIIRTKLRASSAANHSILNPDIVEFGYLQGFGQDSVRATRNEEGNVFG